MSRPVHETQKDTSSHAPDNILVAVAWPYANGERHIGHASSLVPADVLARYHRSVGNHVLMVGGTDEHGTPNRIAAEEQRVDPQEYVNGTSELIRRDFIDLGMSFDWFTRTTSPVHKENAQAIFESLADKGYIVKGSMQGSYDEVTQEALADRYVEGKCPTCGAHSRGDQCDDCGRLLDPVELIDPVSTRTNNDVIFRETEHYFLDLESLSGKVSDFLSGKVDLRDDARRFSESIVNDLKPRSITREMDWGVKLPEKYDLTDEQRVMYVWFEAVIGYISAAKEWSKETGDGESWKDWWQNDDATHVYAMGKDNVPFHTLVWPAILEGLNAGSDDNWHLPDKIASTGNLNFKDGKFSSSKGNVIYINDLVDSIGPDALRFYCIAAGPETKDSVFSYDDLARKVNDELLSKWGNLVSRSITLVKKNNDGEIPTLPDNLEEDAKQLLDGIRVGFDDVGSSIQQTEFSKALRKVMVLVSDVNKYINAHEPWKGYKIDKIDANNSMAVVIHSLLNLNVMMAPFIPHASQRTYELFGGAEEEYLAQPVEAASKEHGVEVLTGDYSSQLMRWEYSDFKELTHVTGDTQHLFQKIDPEILENDIKAKLAKRTLGSIASKAAFLNP